MRTLWVSLLVVLGCPGCTLGLGEPGVTRQVCTEVWNDVCVGVDNAAGDYAGACPCSEPARVVRSRAQLDAALAGEPGCIALREGDYGAVDLPGGFELVGASVESVALDRLSFAGDNASACRMRVRELNVTGNAAATLQYVHVAGSGTDAVLLEPGGSARVVGSTIEAGAGYGISAFDARSLRVERTLIAGMGGPGIWLQCSDGCACAARPELSMRDSVVRETSIVALSLVGAEADLQGIRITSTAVGANFESGMGLSASACSSIVATDLELSGNADLGLLVDESEATLATIEVRENLRGIWARAATMHVAGATIADNHGLGLALQAESLVTVEDTILSDTKNIAVPVLVGGTSAGAAVIGHGICWEGSAVARLRRVHVGGSDRIGIIIVGPAQGVLDDVKLTHGDQVPGIVQVAYHGGAQPSVSGVTPPIHVSAEDLVSGCAN